VHVKLLGITLDSMIKSYQHVTTVLDKATRECLVIKRLHGARPKQVRQLYHAAVTPVRNHCASMWYGRERWGTHSPSQHRENTTYRSTGHSSFLQGYIVWSGPGRSVPRIHSHPAAKEGRKPSRLEPQGLSQKQKSSESLGQE
jgi:hypothetical protein